MKTTDYTTKITELQADVHTMWKLQCQNLYNSKNLGALAVRECLQNSIDAIKSAIAAGQITADEAFISIDLNDSDQSLVIRDNGIGMDIKTIHEKFLTLGGTTKGNKDNVGGFGLAKSVILGCGEYFQVRTQDNMFSPDDLGKNPVRKIGQIQGTEITLKEVQTGRGKTIFEHKEQFKDSIFDYVKSSKIEYTVKIDGEVCEPWFVESPETVRSLAQFNIDKSMVPQDTQLKINVYKDESDGAKYLYIRLRGLTQFKQYLGWNANCNIVLDFQTSLDPRSMDYPFATNREGLKAQYYGIIEAIRDKVTQSPMSISSNDTYKETFYDNVNGSVEQARAISASISNKTTEELVFELSKIVDGIVPQNKCKAPSVAERAKQHNEQLEKIASEQGVTKQELVKKMSPDTAKKIDNPLEYSWIVWEDKSEDRKLNKNKATDIILIWDSILRVMAENYEGFDGKVFYPGIVTKKDTLGLCVEKPVDNSYRTYVMLNPYEIKGEDDTQIALYLMGIASHELAHFICGCFEAHGETFSYTREAIMNDNLAQLGTIIKLVKAGKLKRTVEKLSPRKSQVNDCPYKFTDMTLDEITDMAESYGVDIYFYQSKYSNEAILRMRLIMAIKKAYKEA